MRVFKLEINDESPIYIGVEWGSLTIYIDVEDTTGESYLLVSGKENGAYRIEWVSKQLVVGDKIKLKPSNYQAVSKPLQIQPINIEDMRRRYWELKKELEEKGILCK